MRALLPEIGFAINRLFGRLDRVMLRRADTTTGYAIVAADHGRHITLSNAAAIAVTIGQAGNAFPDGWFTTVENIGAGLVTITPTTSTINGAATLVIPKGAWFRITSDGANYRAVRGGSPGKATIWVPAGAMLSRTTNGGATGTTESSSNKVMNKTLDFDTTTQEFAQFTVAFPKGWDEGTVSFQAYWTAASGSGGVAFSLAGVALSDDDAIDTAFGTAIIVTDTLITALDVHATAESAAVTISGTPAVGDLTYFQVARVPADAGDTLAVDAKLIGIRLFFTYDDPTDL